MSRRRMIDPSFFEDNEVSQLTRDERCFVMGCISNSDDEGRLLGNRSFLKSRIFTYDDDIDHARMEEMRDSALEKMKLWRSENYYIVELYQNGSQEYLYFPNWFKFNKPSHPKESTLPAPPHAQTGTPELIENDSGGSPEAVENGSGIIPSQVRGGEERLGQSSLGKFSVGQSREVQDDFSKFSNEKDLTDFLTTTIKNYMPRGPTFVMASIKKFWRQRTSKEVDDDLFQVIYAALSKYPPPVLAKSLVKSAKYAPGKRKPANYLSIVFEEQMEEYNKEAQSGKRSPP